MPIVSYFFMEADLFDGSLQPLTLPSGLGHAVASIEVKNMSDVPVVFDYAGQDGTIFLDPFSAAEIDLSSTGHFIARGSPLYIYAKGPGYGRVYLFCYEKLGDMHEQFFFEKP